MTLWLQYLLVSQKVLNSDKVVSQRSASIPNAVEDSSCLICVDHVYMFVGMIFVRFKIQNKRIDFQLNMKNPARQYLFQGIAQSAMRSISCDR